MVERKEIEYLGNLIKIELNDPQKYVKQVEQILKYYDNLDKVDYNSEKILRNEISPEKLREDVHEPFCNIKPLIDDLKKDQNNFIRAPKMI